MDKIVIENDDGIPKDLTLKEAEKVVEFNYNAPKIKLEPIFYEQSLEAQVKHMHRLASTMNHAAELLQNERNDLLEKINSAEENLRNSNKGLEIQKTINHNLMTKMNEAAQSRALMDAEWAERVRNLEEELDRYKK